MNGNRLCRDADVTATDTPIAEQAAGNEFCSIDPNRETDSLCRQNRRRINSDNLATRVDERAAGVSRVQGGVGLNDILDQATRVRAQRSSERADHARRHRGLKPVRIADRNRHLSRPQLLRVSEGNGLQTGSINSNHGKIGRRIITDGVSRSAAAVRECYLDSRRVVHDVAVGENQSVGREYEAGAASTALAWLAEATSAGL